MRAHTEANGSAALVQATTAEDMPEACVKRACEAIRAVLDGIPPRGDDETIIAYCYREREAIKRHGSRGMPDDEFNKWVDKHDAIEEAIGRHSAASLHDVEIKFSVLCDRLREDVDPHYRTEAATFMIAQCALEDLRRLVANT